MQALALILFAAPLVQDPQVLDARIDSVTVYPSSAHVHRSSEVLTADGSYVISGLTNELDRSRVRVKCASAEIVRVEVLERLQKEVTDEEFAALVEELKAGVGVDIPALVDRVAGNMAPSTTEPSDG